MISIDPCGFFDYSGLPGIDIFPNPEVALSHLRAQGHVVSEQTYSLCNRRPAIAIIGYLIGPTSCMLCIALETKTDIFLGNEIS